MIDVLSLVLVVSGVGCYAWSYVGMRALRASVHDPSAELFAGYTRYVRLWQLSVVGLTAVALGVLVGVWAALHSRRVGST